MMKASDIKENVLERISQNCYHVVTKKQYDSLHLPGFLDNSIPEENDMALIYIEQDYSTPFKLACTKEGTRMLCFKAQTLFSDQSSKIGADNEIANLTSLGVYTKMENNQLKRKKVCVNVLCAAKDKNVLNDIYFAEEKVLEKIEEDGISCEDKILVRLTVRFHKNFRLLRISLIRNANFS